jgi:Glycogen recognition site of AMP-activated protein kinase
MEMRKAIISLRRLLPVLLLVLGSFYTNAQPPIKQFSLKNGHMQVMCSKNIPEISLDSFIVQYDLQELNLAHFLKTGKTDSLLKLGWTVDLNNSEIVLLSKPMQPLVTINNPEARLLLAQNVFNATAGAASKEPTYGFNRFRKTSFTVRDSLVTFFLRNNKDAKQVKLAGSFTNWQAGAFNMQRADSGWVATVKLAPGKYFYKFIIDGNWTIDRDNQLVENDGQGNDNSVYYKTNKVFKLAGYSTARKVYVSGSFNNWDRAGVLMLKTATGWERPLYLADGTHTYRFVADGKWFADPENPGYAPNEYGENNSVISFGKSYLFYLKGFENARKVTLMGSFNNWRNFELPMQKTDSGWQIRYMLGHGNYEYAYVVDGQTAGRNKTLVIAPNHSFRLKGFEKATRVCIAGDFNKWSPDGFPMQKQVADWVTEQHLLPGKHVYKFVVDGKWITDPGNKLREPNEFNEENSVIWITE